MIIRCLALVLLVLITANVHADTVPLPDETVSDKERARFRLCRAAILVEHGAGENERTILPPTIIIAMREQIEFIMAETIYGVPSLNIEDGAKRLEFTERFILDFGRTVAGEKRALKDLTERTAILLDCQPLLWAVTKERINILMQWRRRALGLDRPFPVDDVAHSE